MIFTANDVAGLGTILSIWAHPDDESWCTGGLLAQASKNGQRVVCVTATCGEAGTTSNEIKWPQTSLGDIRKREMAASLNVLGVAEHKWLNCKDGKLDSENSSKCIAELQIIIDEIRPDTVITFGKDGFTGHNDHKIIHEWTKQALQQTNPAPTMYCVAELEEHFNSAVYKRANAVHDLFSSSTKPNLIKPSEADILFQLPDDIKNKKFKALQSHASQIERLIKDPDGYEFVISLCNEEALVKEIV